MASADAYYYEPAAGHGLRHDPLNAIVGPRPIGWISSQSAAGVSNLAPYSFFNIFNYAPALVGFSSIGWKDTVANVKETGEFCWNLATRPLAEAMNLSCTPAPADVDEFEVTGLTKASSQRVSPPRVLESPVNFECRLTQIVQLRAASGADIATWLVLGEVVAVHVDRRLIAADVYDTIAAAPILRAGGPGDFIEVTGEALFRMQRPGWPITDAPR